MTIIFTNITVRNYLLEKLSTTPNSVYRFFWILAIGSSLSSAQEAWLEMKEKTEILDRAILANYNI